MSDFINYDSIKPKQISGFIEIVNNFPTVHNDVIPVLHKILNLGNTFTALCEGSFIFSISRYVVKLIPTWEFSLDDSIYRKLFDLDLWPEKHSMEFAINLGLYCIFSDKSQCAKVLRLRNVAKPFKVFHVDFKLEKLYQRYYGFIFHRYDSNFDEVDFSIFHYNFYDIYKSWGDQLIYTVNVLNSAKITHGDLKQVNLCLDYESGLLKIIDFGSSEITSFSSNYMRNTFGWFTPVQAWFHARKYDRDHVEKISDKIQDLLVNKYKFQVEYLDSDNYIIRENLIYNDRFAVALNLMFIYGWEYYFWMKGSYRCQCDCELEVYKNVIEFLTDPERYISEALLKMNYKKYDGKIKEYLMLGIKPN